MAENINIKVLIDAADSAKTIQETKKALRDLKTAALQVEEGSQAFQSITTAAGQLQDRIGDLSATTKYLGDDLKNLKGLSSIGQGIAGGFAVAQGAAALFGSENKKVEESILKVQSALSLLQGVQAIGEVLQKESAATLFIQNGLRKTAIALTSEQAVATAAEAVAAGTATLAQRALNAAMNANPVMALVAVLGLAVGALLAFSNGSEEAKKAEEKARKETEARTKAIKEEEAAYASFIGKEQAGYLLLSEQLKATNPKSQERLDLIKKINETYGTTLKNLQDETTFQNQVNKSVEDYIEFLKLKYALQSNEKLISDNIAKQAKLERDLAKEQASLNESIEARKRAGYKDTGRDLRIALELQYKVVDDLQKQIDGADRRLEGYIKGALATTAKISATGLKVSNERVQNENKTNKKVLDAHKEFSADYSELDETIFENTKSIQEELVSSWLNVYDQELLDLQASMVDKKDVITSEYNSALTEVQNNFKEWAESNKIDLVKLDATEYNKQYNLFLNSQAGLNQKLIILKQQYTTRLSIVDEQYRLQQEKLTKEQAERIKQILLDSTKIVLSTTEYSRYLNYIELKTKLLKKDTLATNKETYDKIAEEYSRNFDNFEKYQKLQKELGKSVAAEAYLSEKGYYELRAQDIAKLNTDQTLLYDQNITDSKEFIENLGKQEIKLKSIGSDMNMLMTTTGKVLDIWTSRASRIDDMGVLKEAFFGQEEAITAADLTLVGYLDTLQRVGKTDEKTTLAIINFGKALDQVKDSIDTTNDAWGSSIKITEKYKENTGELIYKVLDLGRALTTSEAGQNKLLTAVYLDKLNILKGAEKDISKEITTINAKNIETGQKFITEQGKLVDALKKQLENKNLSPIDKLKYENDLKAAEEALKNYEITQGKFVEKQKTQKSFSIKPQGPDQIGLEQLIKDYPELNQKILDLLEKRYADQTKIANDFYQEEKNGLFMQLTKGEITQEQYDKKMEAMEIAHQENLLSIDVSYGKKGQDELAASEAKKAGIIKAEQDKIIESKEKWVQEMVNLEAVLQNGIMDMLNFNFQRRIDNLNSEYDYKIGLIQAEQDAYEQSLTEQTVAEIQIATKKQEFQDQIDAQNKQRAAEERQIKLQQFNAQKAADIIQAGINGALAFTKSLAELGPYAIAIQGLIAAQVASQIFFISSQQPAFAEGGLVVGPGGPKDDKINAKLSNGESVINAKSTKMFAPVLSAINQAGGGKAIPSQAGGKMALGGGGTMTVGEKPLVVDNRELIDEIRNLNNRPIETYVSESKITAAQKVSDRENRRTSF